MKARYLGRICWGLLFAALVGWVLYLINRGSGEGYYHNVCLNDPRLKAREFTPCRLEADTVLPTHSQTGVQSHHWDHRVLEGFAPSKSFRTWRRQCGALFDPLGPGLNESAS